MIARPRPPQRARDVLRGMTDRRRPQFERRGTVPTARPLTLEQQLYGERRQHPKEQ